jgi:crotonobetaine/carnitine-CoA ligase
MKFHPETSIDPRTLTFGKVLADKRARIADKLFLHNLPDGRKWTYGEFDHDSSRMASGFDRAGVAPREHVAVMMENCPEQLLSYFALGKLGACTVPVNTAARGELLVYFLTHADCSTIVVEQNLLPRVLEVTGSLPLLKRIFVVADDSAPSQQRHAAAVPVLQLASLLSCEAEPLPYEPVFSDLAFLMFTSGTTGPSKAIMYTQAHTLYWGWDYAQHHHYTADDTLYVYLPLFHGNGWLCNTLGALMADASVALAKRFSASRFWRDVAVSGATVTNCLGAVATFLWVQPPRPQDLDHRMRRMGVSPVPAFGGEFQARFGVTIMSAYGLTDYCMATAYSALHPREKLGSCGTVRKGVQVRIADEHDMPLPPGVPGEIVIRSDNTWGASLGYYKMPEASLAARRNMWFHTGDRGHLDADGYLYFKDRIKDAIRRRGENISAFEVECVVHSHPAVQVAAVYAVKAESTEDEVAVSVVLHPGGTLTEADLVDHCRNNLAYFMVPRYVEFVDSLPMTLSQKVEKYQLRARAQARLAQMWDRVAAGIVLKR